MSHLQLSINSASLIAMIFTVLYLIITTTISSCNRMINVNFKTGNTIITYNIPYMVSMVLSILFLYGFAYISECINCKTTCMG